MKIEQLNKDNIDESGHLLYKVISGSHSYGTSLPTSDIDMKGVYFVHPREYMRMDINPVFAERMVQISDERHDLTYYSIRRFIELASTANPNIIELLWSPDDCILYKHPSFDILLEKRKAFMTKKAFETYAHYANSQIHKAKGANKRINNPQKKERPTREEFCMIIPFETNVNNYLNKENKELASKLIIENIFPCRPQNVNVVELNDKPIDLSKCHVAALEHVPNTYRLYDYSDDKYVRGVFQNNALVCQNISKEDEWKRFIGFLIYNSNEYDRALREWSQYWTWMKERNQSRWIDQEKGKLNYDAKNMCHCIRLLKSAKNIFEKGEPIVRFEGEDLKLLLEIRQGTLEYDKIINMSNDLIEEIKLLKDKSTLPPEVDVTMASEIFNEITSAKLNTLNEERP